MNALAEKFIVLFLFLLVAAVIVRDSLFHFNVESIEFKRENNSAMRHWNIGYNPRYVYLDSTFRYRNDFAGIAAVIEPGHALLSDLATSYYAAAELPVYVLNVHRHHASKRVEVLAEVLRKREFCYLEDVFHRQAAMDYLQHDARLAEKNNWPALRYLLLNKDKRNSMLWDDCLPMRSDQLEVSLLLISTLLYEGEYLNMYEIHSFDEPPGP